MSKIIDIAEQDEIQAWQEAKQEFRQDVSTGLGNANKYLLSKYFYDETGSELFNQITRHPDYYLTACEYEILTKHHRKIAQYLGQEHFNLIELGPGEAIKSKILLEALLRDQAEFRYTPIDISLRYLQELALDFNQCLPEMKISPIHADFLQGLSWQSEHSGRRNLVLFLGSSIGNYNELKTAEFLRQLHDSLNSGDYLLIGFDLRKDVDLLIRAYNDSDGLTREFNLNLLRRINRELGANFNLSQFYHYPTYNVQLAAMESYLLSRMPQTVTIEALSKTIRFEAYEPIHLEYSFKYSLEQINRMAHATGFKTVECFQDSKGYFVDALWQV